MVFYIFLPVVQFLLQMFYLWMRRCVDECCLPAGRFTRKSTQDDMNNYYLGPQFNIEIKYSAILNVICTNLIYGSGLPVLYFSTFLFLLLSYWLDKYVFLKVCRKPYHVDLSISHTVKQIIKGFLIIHLVWSIWIYGSPAIFPDESEVGYKQNEQDQLKQQTTDAIGSIYQNDNVITEFFNRALRTQCIPLLIVLLIIFIYYVIYPILIKKILLCIFFCGNTNQSIQKSKVQ